MIFPYQPHQNNHKQNRKRHHNSTQATIQQSTTTINFDVNSVFKLFTPMTTPLSFSSSIFPLPNVQTQTSLLASLLALKNLASSTNSITHQQTNQHLTNSIFPQFPNNIQKLQQEIIRSMLSIPNKPAVKQQNPDSIQQTRVNNSCLISYNDIKNETKFIKKFDFTDIASCIVSNQQNNKGTFSPFILSHYSN